MVLRKGGLFVNNPVAPTPECLQLLQELVDRHGPVKYIALSSAALEHKTFLRPFTREFPDADVWIAPGQWAWPLNIGIGFWSPGSITGVIRDTDTPEGACAPWADELECAVLRVGGSAFTGFTEPWFVDVAWLHRDSGTVLVTDAVLQVPLEPPAVCALDPEPLLLRACDVPGTGRQVADTPENRRKGWWRVCLFATYVAPDAQTREGLGYDGFRWADGWEEGFLGFAGRLIVHPILRVLCFNRRPTEVLAWADKVAKWPVQRVVPGHFEAPVAAGPAAFRAAFRFLEEEEAQTAGAIGDEAVFADEDLDFLRKLDADTVKNGTSEPPAVYKNPLIPETASQ